MGSMARGNGILSAGLMVVLLASAGCETSDDPRAGGFLGGLHGLTSGAYDRRLQAQQAQLGGAQREAQYLVVDNRRLASEAGETASERKRLQRQLTALDAKTAELTARASQLRADTDARRQQRSELEERLRQVRGELPELNRDVEANRVSAAAAQSRKAELEKELQELTVVFNALR